MAWMLRKKNSIILSDMNRDMHTYMKSVYVCVGIHGSIISKEACICTHVQTRLCKDADMFVIHIAISYMNQG